MGFWKVKVKALDIAEGDTITFVDLEPPRSVTVADVVPLPDGSVRVEVEPGPHSVRHTPEDHA